MAKRRKTWWQKLRSRLGYDATEDRGRRRAPKSVIKPEHQVADERKRRILSATTADLHRNFAVAAWAIRKHLDYVSSFRFQGATEDRGYNREFEAIVKEQMTRHRFDFGRRHSFRRSIRLLEAHRCRDGDHMWMKLAPAPGSNTRGKIQMIEGDRFITPKRSDMKNRFFDKDDWANGVWLGAGGQARAYGLHDRVGSGQYKFSRVVNAKNILHHAWWDRVDQVRGISPISSALNHFRDTYEGMEYSFAKLKVGQLFGLVTYRDAEFGLAGPATTTATNDEDEDGTDESGYEVDFGRGPFNLDLEPGDKADILESKTPSAETVNFLKLMIMVCLRSLDIPFSLFDESFTNFYGSRGGLIGYLKSCTHKMEDISEFLDEWAKWRFGLLIADGELDLPRGKDFSWLRWEFVPDGTPWWNREKEVKGASAAVASGFDNPQRICRESNTDFFENIDRIAEAHAYAREQGVEIQFGASTAVAPDFSQDEVEDADGLPFQDKD